MSQDLIVVGAHPPRPLCPDGVVIVVVRRDQAQVRPHPEWLPEGRQVALDGAEQADDTIRAGRTRDSCSKRRRRLDQERSDHWRRRGCGCIEQARIARCSSSAGRGDQVTGSTVPSPKSWRETSISTALKPRTTGAVLERQVDDLWRQGREGRRHDVRPVHPHGGGEVQGCCRWRPSKCHETVFERSAAPCRTGH